jgi:hypothetical protein
LCSIAIPRFRSAAWYCAGLTHAGQQDDIVGAIPAREAMPPIFLLAHLAGAQILTDQAKSMPSLAFKNCRISAGLSSFEFPIVIVIDHRMRNS